MPTDAALLTAQDVMAQLGVGRAFVNDHRAELGGIKIGSRLRFDQAGIDAYKARQRVTAPVQTPIATARPPLRLTTSPVGKVTGHVYTTTRQPLQSGGGR